MKHKHFNRLLSMLLVVATLFGLLAVPASAATLENSGTVTIQQAYYTCVVYLASATSTWIDGRKTKVYSTDAPQDTIFVAENNSPLETTQENGATCYLVDTSRQHSTNLNSNGSEYYGTFKVGWYAVCNHRGFAKG